jgi:hypothetical protein
MSRRPRDYPRLTRSEAVSWLAFNRYLIASEIGRLRGRCAQNELVSALPRPIRERLDVARSQLRTWMLDRKVAARGWLYDRDGHSVASGPADIPTDFIFDGVWIVTTPDRIDKGLPHPAPDSICRDQLNRQGRPIAFRTER